ncbi:MAG: hypothetical protein VX017_01335, partial [Pseudomonadota bacterium]|nr:hypothetical protein [Pseudomonadota bacterium]
AFDDVAGGGRPVAAVRNKVGRILLIYRKLLIKYMRNFCDKTSIRAMWVPDEYWHCPGDM